MNNASATDSTGLLAATNIGGIAYGICVSIVLLLLITTIVLASFYCSRTATRMSSSPAIRGTRITRNSPESTVVVLDIGLDEETIESYPKMMFSVAKLENKEAIATSCSICLGDYRSSDMLRQLPDCDHCFHLKCVDPWLRLNPSCPLCRTSPYPTPVSTPLAEVIPLARSRDS